MKRRGSLGYLGRLIAMSCVAISTVACSGSTDGNESSSRSVTGSLEDWQAAVCMPGMPTGPSTTRGTVSGTQCHPRIGPTYINFDQFDSEYDMNTALSYAVMNYSAKTTVGGHPFAIWVPASRDGGELAPLEQFGFVVGRQQRSGQGGQLPSVSSAVAQPSPSPPQVGTESSGKNFTIADYIKQNGFTATPIVKSGDPPGAPILNLPSPPGWRDSGNTPSHAYGQIVPTDPAFASDPPTITAIYSRLTGDVDVDALLRYAPNELKNLPGYQPDKNRADTLAGYRAVALSGSYLKDGVQRVVGQKTAVVPGRNGVYVLQLSLETAFDNAQASAATEAFRVINDQTVITP